MFLPLFFLLLSLCVCLSLMSLFFFCRDGYFFAVKEVSLLDQGSQGKQNISYLEQVKKSHTCLLFLILISTSNSQTHSIPYFNLAKLFG